MSLFWKDRAGPEPSGREPGDSVPHNPPPSRCSTVPVSAWISFGGCFPCWDLGILWNLPRLSARVLPSPHHLYLLFSSLFSRFSFRSVSHICACLSVPSPTSLLRKMLHLFGIIKFMKCSTCNSSSFKKVHVLLASQPVCLPVTFFQLC